MKKLFLIALAMLVTVSLSAASLETKGSYVSVQSTPVQGMAYGLTYGFNVYEGTGFFKDVIVGPNATFAMFNGSTYDVFLAPTVKVLVPLAYAEAGFGYDIIKTAGTYSNDYAWMVGAGVQGNLTDTVKVSLGFDLKHSIKADAYSWLIGPAFSFNL